MKIMLYFTMLFISFFMTFLTHPISMGLMILIQTLMMCMLMGMLYKTYWFSYILFLIFLGGLLVMFIYVSSIASNELFNFSMKNKFFLMIMMMILIMLMLILNNNLKFMNLSNNLSDNNNFYHIYMFNNENKINLNKLYNNHNFLMMMTLMIYLFITLIAVVKITNIFYGPLRSFN
uniref:NADH dehydrogenase subunit 6 n=1 Tax=Somatina indicataria TaxID=1430671 RepID=UPI001F13EDBD|nr:NADH dehydrogenase subunit 6 [Somatina indicataria]UKT61757.1 NADH dehydrogenase subunit 6 [Somatina indicataria]